jgi:hypothetical protein
MAKLESSTLSWTTTNATTVTIDQGVGAVALTGTVDVTPTVDTTYTLTADGTGGPVTQQVTVTVTDPSAVTIDSFTADPITIALGASSTLSWATTNASTVNIDQSIGTVAGTGTVDVTPTETTTYTLTADGTGGPLTQQVTVNVVTIAAPDRWWKLDDGSGTTAADSSGNAVDGTLVNMDAGAWTTGLDGSALVFDGVDDHLSIPDNTLPTESYYADGDFTVVFWMKLSADAQMHLMRRSTESAQWWAMGRSLHVKKDGANPMYLEGFVWDGTEEFATGTTPLQLDTWYHVAGVYNCDGGGGGLRVFLDGALEGTAYFGGMGGFPQDSWFIGRELDDPGVKYYAAFDGVIDDIRVYNAVLTDAEIAGLATGTAEPTVTITAPDASASETGPDTGTFRVSRTGDTTAALAVALDFTGSTAAAADYTSAPDISGGSVDIPAGEPYVDVVITPVADGDDTETDEDIVVAVDDSGGGYVAGSPATATVTIAVAPDNPPAVTITSPSDGEHVYDTVNVSGSASDDIGVDTVEVNVGGAGYVMATGDASWSIWTCSFDASALSDGDYQIDVRATDTGGNETVVSTTITVDPSATTEPSINVTSPAGGETWYVGTTRTISWTAINLDAVAIFYSTNDGGFWNIVDDAIMATESEWGAYPWTVPDEASPDCVVKVQGYLGEVPTQSGTFTISAVTDNDGDGMDDDWENATFGDMSHDETTNADGDGATDYEEFMAGTDPLVNEGGSLGSDDSGCSAGSGSASGSAAFTLLLAAALVVLYGGRARATARPNPDAAPAEPGLRQGGE